MAQPHELTMLQQAAAVRRRELSPAELTAHYLERIDRLNAGLGAVPSLRRTCEETFPAPLCNRPQAGPWLLPLPETAAIGINSDQ